MPTRPYRTRELHDHLARQTTVPYSAARLRHLNPAWPSCPRCPWPINPAALVGGFTTHPNCEA